MPTCMYIRTHVCISAVATYGTSTCVCVCISAVATFCIILGHTHVHMCTFMYCVCIGEHTQGEREIYAESLHVNTAKYTHTHTHTFPGDTQDKLPARDEAAAGGPHACVYDHAYTHV
jgi:hypothetical protein